MQLSPAARAVGIALALAGGIAAAEDLGLRAPDGFEVTLFAGDELAHDIYSMTLDPQGRVVVAGAGYVKILHDENGDGVAEKATLFSDSPKSGAHGMVFVGSDLIATGDNLLLKLEDKNADGVADGRPIPLAIVNSPEHGANGVIQGPDGWIYLVGGNDAGIGAQLAQTKTSPVKKPQAGAVVRFSPDFKTSEIFAHGFRNPYDLAFNENGQLFTVDADGERDHYLPWYTPTRLFDIQQGMHHGWVQQGWTRAWARPQSFFDNVPRLVEIGRGSPTGLECYRHYAFPSEYRGNIYSCCWTLGTVYRFPLTREGSSYKSHKEIFLQTTGEVGFAPVDLAVGPQGEMYVAIGGRGTRGSVFCVRYTGKLKPEEQAPKAETELNQVLTAPQPLAAWSRAKWMPLARKLGRDQLEEAALDGPRAVHECIRAIEIATELYGELSLEPFTSLADRRRPEVLQSDDLLELEARALWSAARGPSSEVHGETLARATSASDEVVARAAWESMASIDGQYKLKQRYCHWDQAWYQSPRIRSLSFLMAEGVELDGALIDTKLIAPITLLRGSLLTPDEDAFVRSLGQFQQQFVAEDGDFLRRSIDVQKTAHLSKRDLIRAMQLCLGDLRVEPTKPDVFAGYIANDVNRVPEKERRLAAQELSGLFPFDDDELNRETTRLIGMLQVKGDYDRQLVEKLADRFSVKSTLQDDIHYLIVLSRIDGERTDRTTQRTAGALAFLAYRMMFDGMVPSRNWPLRVGEVFVELCQRDPNLANALARHPEFNLPQHAMFAALMPEKQRAVAARRLLEKSKGWGEETFWTPEMVRVVAALGEADALAAVRAQWHDFSLRDVILETLAAKPDAANRELFFQSLTLPDTNSVARAATAIAALDATGSPEEIAVMMAAIRQQCNAKENRAARVALAGALAVLTEETFETPEPEMLPEEGRTGETPMLRIYQPWFDWFAEEHPEASKQLNAAAALDGVDLAERVARIDWAAGDAERGAVVYNARACAKCHSGASRLGPELTGVTGRWSHEDLLREIADPNRNVAPQFHTMRLITRDGKVYQGVLVYDSPEGTLIQTAADTTLRIAGDEIVSTAKTTQSLMPTGLLNGLADAELADLVAYLRTLAPARQ